jgi:drug/metabolite transporter (DMT)-like permease
MLVLGLGAFWGISPALNKALGLAGVPVSHILIGAGLGVGVGLMILQRIVGDRSTLSRNFLLYGLGCGILVTVPWGLGLLAIRHLPVTIAAILISTTPLWTYGLALLLGRDKLRLERVGALALGFLACLALILTRPGAGAIRVDGWLLVYGILPILYGLYNNFAAAAWPSGVSPLMAGVGESISSGLLGLPIALAMDPGYPPSAIGLGYGLLLGAVVLWVVERVCFFTMTQQFGPVTTVQAVYVSTPASVVFGMLLYGEPTDSWLWASLALVMAGLWLDGRRTMRTAEAGSSDASDAHQPDGQPLQEHHPQPVAAIDE